MVRVGGGIHCDGIEVCHLIFPTFRFPLCPPPVYTQMITVSSSAALSTQMKLRDKKAPGPTAFHLRHPPILTGSRRTFYSDATQGYYDPEFFSVWVLCASVWAPNLYRFPDLGPRAGRVSCGLISFSCHIVLQISDPLPLP